MKTIQERVNDLNDKIDDLDLKIIKLQKEIEYSNAVKDKLKRKKVKLLKEFNY